MLQAMYNGVSAISATQTNMDIIGNNIANVNTDGFKASTVSFATQLSDTLQSGSAPGATVGGTDPQQVGLGVSIGSINTNTSQGALTSSSSPTDMAINGNGYFQVASATGGVQYTRDGHFALDSTGQLVQADTGEPVLGWTASAAGSINTSASITPASTLQIDIGGVTSAKATTGAIFSGNLSADDAAGATYSRSVNVYDSQGVQHTININFTRGTASGSTPGAAAFATSTASSALAGQVYAGQITIGGIQYNMATGGASGDTLAQLNTDISSSGYAATVANGNQLVLTSTTTPAPGGPPAAIDLSSLSAGPDTAAGDQTITFGAVSNTNGVAASPATATNVWTWTATGDPGLAAAAGTTNQGTITFDGSGSFASQTGSIVLNPVGTATQNQPIALNLSSLTEFSGADSVAPTSQDGFAPGTLQSFSVDQNGVVNGVFANGQTAVLGQIALAGFANPGGLSASGTNTFTTSANSGNPVTGAANTAGLGSIQTSYLEQSNVDLGTEFTNMIIAQRSFQANTKIVTAVDEMLNDLIQMKQ